jgi:hypothetical protein
VGGGNTQAGDYWFAAMQLNSVGKPRTEFKSGRTRLRSGAVIQIRKLSNKVNTQLGGFCQPLLGTSGTPEARPDALRHNRLVLAQGIEP